MLSAVAVVSHYNGSITVRLILGVGALLAAMVLTTAEWGTGVAWQGQIEIPQAKATSRPSRHVEGPADNDDSKVAGKFAQVSQAPAPVVPETAAPAQSPSTTAPSGTNPVVKLASARQADANLVLTLVSSVMLALHQANITGNYTVLRDMSAPGFRNKNSATDLGRIFAPIRDAKIDLSQTVLLDPHISTATFNDKKMLYLVGAFETKPVPVTFELLFEPVEGNWQVSVSQ